MSSASQRLHPDLLLDCLIDTFYKSTVNEFRAFLAKHAAATKWIIACDFVINEPQATSDAYALTFYPYKEEIGQLKAKIAKLVPKDFKETKEVGPELHEFLKSGETFTVCFLTPKKYRIGGDLLEVRRSLDETIAMMRHWHDAAHQQRVIGAFERLRQRANANGFNAQLMSTMIFATVLAAFCAVILAKETKVDIVGWFPDRDNITTSYDQIAHHMFAVNFSAFCQRHNIDERLVKPVIGIPTPDTKRPNQTWYDELVRIPDFVAGPLASWNFRDNLVPDKQKYLSLLEGAVADNPTLVTLLLSTTDGGFGIARLRCSKTPPAPDEQ